MGPSRSGKRPARAAPRLLAECLLPCQGAAPPAAQRGEGAEESALPVTGARLRVLFSNSVSELDQECPGQTHV